jgi:Tol biopolymer transport system component
MDAGGGNAITVATADVTDQYCTERWSLSWSPDGTSLIFPISSACQSGYELHVVPTDGSSPATKLLAPGTNSLYGTWSPDGTQIAFLGTEDNGSVGLYVADVAQAGALSGGLSATRIGPDLGSDLSNPTGRPQWSPDGKMLAAVAPPEDVFVINADGTGQRVVAPDAYNPAWSPDGKQLAVQRTVDRSEYWNDRPCTVRTWLVDAAGGNERQLEELGDGCGFAPTWSPDGTRLASVLIAAAPGDPERSVRPGAEPSQLWWHLGFVTLDGSSPPVLSGDSSTGTWRPVDTPLPPAPSFAVDSQTP